MRNPTLRFYLSLIVSTILLAATSCNRSQNTDTEHITNCIDKQKLSLSMEAKVRKEIHAVEKALLIDSIFRHKAARQGFNGTVLIAQKGAVIYEKAFGFSDFKKRDSLTLLSSFQLASISKSFTGVAILLLVQDHKIRLTDSIQQYIPEFPYHGITIEHLLSHRSGLPNYLYCFEEKRKLDGPPPTNDSVINWFNQADSLPALYGNPGKNFSYNNSNFVVLASIIEKASKMSYAEFIGTRIFGPLGMKHSLVDTIAPLPLLRLRTCGHQGNRPRAREFFDGVYGDKGVFSTAGDLCLFYTALHSGCLLNKHWLKEAFTPRSFEHRSRHNYGLGFRLMTDRNDMKKVHYVYHGGWWAGYSTMFWMDPEADIVIIILGNKKNNSVYEIKPILSVLEPTDVEEMNNSEE